MTKQTKTIVIIAVAVVLAVVLFFIVRRLIKKAGNREAIRTNAQTIVQIENAGGKSAELTDSDHKRIADSVYKATNGVGTDESALVAAIESIPTAADYLKVKNAYLAEYESDMYKDIADDVEPSGSFLDTLFDAGGNDDDRIVWGRINAHLNLIAVPENLR